MNIERSTQKNMTIKINILFVFIICFFVYGYIFASPQGKPTKLIHTARTKYFICFHDNTNSYLAILAADIAEEELLRISDELDYCPTQFRPFVLRIYVNHYSFMNSAASDGFDRYTVGLTKSKDQSISIDASSSIVNMREVIAHELTHAVLFRKLKIVNTLPLWFHEGMAKYLSEENGQAKDKATIASFNGEILNLKSLSYRFPKDKRSLAYAESAMAVRLLLNIANQNGYKKSDIVNIAAKSNSFDIALIKTIGVNEKEFCAMFTKKLAKQYSPINLTKTITGIIGVIMVVLLIIAYFVRRKQKLAAIKRWEEEEWINNSYPGMFEYEE